MPDPAPAIVCGRLPRAAWIVAGVDAGSYLHSQLSNDIASLQPGSSCQSFVLEPNGRVDALVRVTRIGNSDVGEYLVDVDDTDPAAVLARLERFKIRVRADTTAVDVKVLAVRATAHEGEGSGAAEAAHIADAARAFVALAEAAGARAWSVPAWWGDGGAVDVIVTGSSEILAEFDDTVVADVATVRFVGDQVVESLRIACGWPAMGAEIRPGETIPAATGVVSRVVSFTKGCYPGQELVERMDSRNSTAPQSLRIVPKSLLEDARPGADVVVDGHVVGAVTSVGDEVALAYVARSVALGEVVGGSGSSSNEANSG